MNTIFKTFCVFVVLSGMHFCQSTNLKLISRWPDGPCNTVEVQGNYAYINNGSAFEIVDISDTSSFKLTGKVDLDDYIIDVKVSGNNACIAGDQGIYIVDVSNKFLPKRISTTPAESSVSSLFIKDNFLYAAGYPSLRIFNINDPSSPKEAGSFSTTSSGLGIFVKDSLAYLACADSGLFILDIKNKINPSVKGRYNFDNKYNPADVYVKDTLAFITSRENKSGIFSYGKLHILDIKNPAKIFERSSIELYGDMSSAGNKVIADGTTVYLTHFSDVGSYLMKVDVSNPDKPKELAIVPIAHISALSIKNKTLYASADYFGLISFDVSSPLSVRPVYNFRTAGYTLSISRKGNYLLNANTFGGLKVLDITDPLLPSEVFSFSSQYGAESCNSVFVKDTILYAGFSSSYNGLVSFDLGSLPQLTKLGEVSGYQFYGIKVSGNYAYATDNYGFFIYNVTDPAHASEVYHYSTGEYDKPYETAIKDTILYAAANKKGLLIFNVSDPSKAAVVKTIPVKNAAGVVLSGKYIYVNSHDEGLRIFDITDPSNPKEAGGYNDSQFASVIKVHKGYAFAAEPEQGIIKVLNVQRPDSVYQAGTGEVRHYVFDIFVDDDFVIAAENMYGLSIFKNDIASSVSDKEEPVNHFSLQQNYPNPFNPATTISYELPEKAYVELKVFDMLGREVATLVSKEQIAGEHRVQFNAGNLTSGMYIYTIQAGEHRDSKKLLLLK